MQDPVSEAEWYRREADKRAELARSFLGEIHQKECPTVRIHGGRTAEGTGTRRRRHRKGGPARWWWPKRGDGYPAIRRTLKIGAAADRVTRGAPNTAPRPARVGTMPVHARDHFFARLDAGNNQIQQSRGAPC
jgi:hypothetical protein